MLTVNHISTNQKILKTTNFYRRQTALNRTELVK